MRKYQKMIEVIDLVFQYPSDSQKKVLEGINLKIRDGENLSIMGKNGSGKTTLVKCLNGLNKPTSGRVIVQGMDTSDTSTEVEIKRLVGIVFQNPDNQIVSATVEREIAFGLENLGIPVEEIHQRVNESLRRFDLERYRHRSPHLLSGGEKQLVALASVLAMRPKYLILDEPTSLLDPKGRKEILASIKSLHSENFSKPITTVLITQFPDEAINADRLLILDEGKILFDDKPENVFQHVEELKRIGLDVPIEFELGCFQNFIDE